MVTLVLWLSMPLVILFYADQLSGWRNLTLRQGLLFTSFNLNSNVTDAANGNLFSAAGNMYASGLLTGADRLSYTTPAAADIPRTSPNKDFNKTRSEIKYSSSGQYLLLSMMMGLLSSLGLLWYLRKGKKKPVAKPSVRADSVSAEQVLQEAAPQASATALYLFGELTLLDDNGIDITRNFSPKLKQLFLMLFVRSFLNSKAGLRTEFITSTLWPDLSLAEAKNNRNVSVNRLRAILSGINGARINVEKSKMTLVLPENFYCDLLEFRIRTNTPDWSVKKFKGLQNMVTRGELFADCDCEWFDAFRQQHKEEVIRRLTGIIIGNHHTETERLALAECLLSQDPVSEPGIKAKLQILSAMGDHLSAKTAFETFKRAYHSVYDTELDKNISDFVN